MMALSKLVSCGARCQVLFVKKKKNHAGAADSRQQLPGKSAGLQASVRRVQLPNAFLQHQQLLVRPCVHTTARSTQLLGQPFLLREVVFCGKRHGSHESLWEGFVCLLECTLFSGKQELR